MINVIAAEEDKIEISSLAQIKRQKQIIKRAINKFLKARLIKKEMGLEEIWSKKSSKAKKPNSVVKRTRIVNIYEITPKGKRFLCLKTAPPIGGFLLIFFVT
ncbi:hypothetical protein K0B03_02925 [Patescibacteria group bacterium]|nr:hypothetical protein [Patescibacteria group bacterium]